MRWLHFCWKFTATHSVKYVWLPSSVSVGRDRRFDFREGLHFFRVQRHDFQQQVIFFLFDRPDEFPGRGAENVFFQRFREEFFGDFFLQAAVRGGSRRVLFRDFFPARRGVVGFERFLRFFDFFFVFVHDHADVARRFFRVLRRLFFFVIFLDRGFTRRRRLFRDLFLNFGRDQLKFDPFRHFFFGEVIFFQEFLEGFFGFEAFFFDFGEFGFDFFLRQFDPEFFRLAKDPGLVEEFADRRFVKFFAFFGVRLGGFFLPRLSRPAGPATSCSRLPRCGRFRWGRWSPGRCRRRGRSACRGPGPPRRRRRGR